MDRWLFHRERGKLTAMAYDAFERGPRPVGVRTRELRDAEREGRSLVVELWYPADARHTGADTDPATRDRFEVMPGVPSAWQEALRDADPASGSFPLIAFSHGFGTERRQSSFLCTHLASHGYVVVAPNHTGNTVTDVLGAFMAAASGGAVPDILSAIDAVTRNRPTDLLFAVGALDSFDDAGAIADRTRLGLAGHSFGGWTALTATARDPSVAAVLALAPAGAHSALIGDRLADKLDLGWHDGVSAQIIAAERDSLLPLAGMHEIHHQLSPTDRRMFVLLNADHMHFSDRPRVSHEMFRTVPNLMKAFNVPTMPAFSELCPGEHALTALRGLGLAHFDAALKRSAEAASFLADNAVSELSRRGIAIDRV